MKILISLALAAIPAVVSAQTVSPTLSMVETLSVSAVSNYDMAAARSDAGKPFAGGISPAFGGPVGGPQVPAVNPPGNNPGPNVNLGGHNNPGNNHGAPPNSGSHNNPGNHNNPGHGTPPPVNVHPHGGPNHHGHNHHQPNDGLLILNLFVSLVDLLTGGGPVTPAAIIISVVLVAAIAVLLL